MKRKMIFVLLLSTGFVGAMDKNLEQSGVLVTSKNDKKKSCAWVLVKKFLYLCIEPVCDIAIAASNPDYIELQQTLRELRYRQ